jgi:integrase
VRIAPGTQMVDGPHILRHSCVSLFVKAKVPLPEIAAFTGMTTTVLERYYLQQSLADQEIIAQTAPHKRPRNGSKRA